jgi:hypothetical protein
MEWLNMEKNMEYINALKEVNTLKEILNAIFGGV